MGLAIPAHFCWVSDFRGLHFRDAYPDTSQMFFFILVILQFHLLSILYNIEFQRESNEYLYASCRRQNIYDGRVKNW